MKRIPWRSLRFDSILLICLSEYVVSRSCSKTSSKRWKSYIIGNDDGDVYEVVFEHTCKQ